MRHRPFLLAVAFVTLLALPSTAGVPGDLDTSFSGDGKRRTDFVGNNDWAYGVAVQRDGKIVVGGYALHGPGNASDFAVARFRPGGGLDPTFHGDGKRIVYLGGSAAWAMAIQPDGRILLGGNAGNGFALIRLRSSGALDPTFSGDGKAFARFAGGIAFCIALQPDGKIVVAGRMFGADQDVAIARWRPNGRLDRTFHRDGKRVVRLAGDQEAQDVAVQPDGKIVIVGNTPNVTGDDFLVARFRPNGALDDTFSVDGWLQTNIAGSDAAYDVLILPNGKILVVGFAGFPVNQDVGLARYMPDGTPDYPFGGGLGWVRTDFGSSELAQGAVRHADGKFVIAGLSSAGGFLVARYRAGGALDPTFGGGDGWVTTQLSGTSDDAGRAIALQRNGRIVVVGESFVGGSADFGVARYLAA